MHTSPRDTRQALQEAAIRAASFGKVNWHSKRRGFDCRSPIRRDKDPSVSVWIDDSGEIAWHDHGGGDWKETGRALGLYQDSQPAKVTGNAETRRFEYQAADGATLVTVCRQDADGDKKIWRDPAGARKPESGWPLFGLPALLAVPTFALLVVEGEATAVAANRLGLPVVATTAIGGAGKAGLTDWSPVAGRTVTIWPDADDPGREHAQAVAQACHAAGAAEVRLVDTSGLPAKWDLADPPPDAFDIRKAFEKAIPIPDPLKGGTGISIFLSTAELQASAAQNADWLVDEMIPAGGTALFVGRPKAGKTTMARNLVVAVAEGVRWLDRECKQGPALYAAFEGSRRAVAAHAEAMKAGDAPCRWYVGPPPVDPIPWLHAAIVEHEARLAVIDPLFRFLGTQDANDYAEATRITQPIIDLAAETGCSIVLLHHSRKGGGELGDEALGSTGLFGAVDTLISLKRDGDRRTFYTVQREGEDAEETDLRMDESRQWIFPGPTKREAAQDAMREAVLSYVQEADNPTVEDILKNVEGRPGPIRAAINHLVEGGMIHRNGTGRKGNPFRFSGMGNN